jgi:hypothetical protein
MLGQEDGWGCGCCELPHERRSWQGAPPKEYPRHLEAFMTEFSYKHYQISIAPYAPTPHHWVAEIRVFSPTATGVSEQELFFPADQSFNTLEEAEDYALTLAKRWLDGEQ